MSDTDDNGEARLRIIEERREWLEAGTRLQEMARAEQHRLKDDEDVETRLKAIEGKLDTALAGIKMLMLFAERHLNLTERHVNVTERQLGEPERKH